MITLKCGLTESPNVIQLLFTFVDSCIVVMQTGVQSNSAKGHTFAADPPS